MVSSVIEWAIVIAIVLAWNLFLIKRMRNENK